MERAPALLTLPEIDRPADRGELQRVKRQEPEIVAHIWHVYETRDAADSLAVHLRGLNTESCWACLRPAGARLVDVAPFEARALGATATLYAVVLRHTRG